MTQPSRNMPAPGVFAADLGLQVGELRHRLRHAGHAQVLLQLVAGGLDPLLVRTVGVVRDLQLRRPAIGNGRAPWPRSGRTGRSSPQVFAR